MDDFLNDQSPEAIARANRQNLLAFFRRLDSDPRTAVWQATGVGAWSTKIPHPWFNVAVSKRQAWADERETITEVIGFFKSRGVKRFTWWLDPDADGSGWETHLSQAGLSENADTPGMGLALAGLPVAGPLPDGLRIGIVEDLSELQIWVRTFLTGYEIPLLWEYDFYHLMAGIGHQLPVRCYIGYLNGKPVATSLMFLAARVAGIYNVATLPEARRRGLGTALTLAPLYEARDMGYRVATLQSSEHGVNVYRQLGFQPVCQMVHYYLGE